MILRVADDDDSASTGFNFVPLRDAFLGIVRALGMKIGMNVANNISNVLLGKDDDCVNIG
jgi:hypothetical protein